MRKPTYEKTLATVVHLMDNLYIRVGNANCAAQNGSFGLTTLRNRHVKIELPGQVRQEVERCPH